MAKSFNQAFAEARRRFDNNPSEANFTFNWNGKEYNVRRQGETKADLMAKVESGSSRPKPRPQRSAPESSPRPARRSGVARPGEASPRDIETRPIGRKQGMSNEEIKRRATAAIERAEAGASRRPTQSGTPRFSERHNRPGNLARSIAGAVRENYRRGGMSNRNR